MEIQSKNKISLQDIDFVRTEVAFYLNYKGVPLKTPKGNDMCSLNDRALQQIMRETYLTEKIDFGNLTAAAIFAFQKDFIEDGEDIILANIRNIIQLEPFYNRKSNKKKDENKIDIDKLLEFLDDNVNSFDFVFGSISSTVRIFNEYLLENNLSILKMKDNSYNEIADFISEKYKAMPSAHKASLSLVSIVHNSGLLLPFLLVNRILSPGEYANVLLSAYIPNNRDHIAEKKMEAIFGQITQIKINPPDWNDFNNSFERIIKEARIACEYSSYFTNDDSKDENLKKLVSLGESFKLEFKSTLRWNIKAERKDAAIEHANLKTIAAFLNSSGGTLLIGVNDDGKALGLNMDKFPNDDRYLLHFWSLVKSSMGQDVSPFLDVAIKELDNEKLLRVSCQPSTRAVFLDFKNYGEEFFIRIGPASASLNISESLKYIRDRFHGD